MVANDLGTSRLEVALVSARDDVAAAVGNTMAILPLVLVAGGCGILVLPAELYQMAAADARFGSVTEDACFYPAGGTALGIYFLTGAPFFALEKILWDWPRSALGDDDARSWPDPNRSPPESRALE